MPLLQIFVDDDTMRRLRAVSVESGRRIEDLAEAAVQEQALMATRHLDDELLKVYEPVIV